MDVQPEALEVQDRVEGLVAGHEDDSYLGGAFALFV